MEEIEEDLFYFAFNYRNAITDDAEDWWKALEKYVEEEKMKERERCAIVCENSPKFSDCARLIRSLK